MTGIRLNLRLGKLHSGRCSSSFNSTFLPLFAIGMAGLPRRVFEYAESADPERLGLDLVVRAGRSILLFVINFIYSTVIVREREDGQRVELARPGVAGLLAAAGRQLRQDPGRALWPVRLRRQGRAAGGRSESATRCPDRRGQSGSISPSGGLAMADTTAQAPALGPAEEEAVFYHEAALERLLDRSTARGRRPVISVRRLRLRVLLPEVAEQLSPLVHLGHAPKMGLASRSWCSWW